MNVLCLTITAKVERRLKVSKFDSSHFIGNRRTNPFLTTKHSQNMVNIKTRILVNRISGDEYNLVTIATYRPSENYTS